MLRMSPVSNSSCLLPVTLYVPFGSPAASANSSAFSCVKLVLQAVIFIPKPYTAVFAHAAPSLPSPNNASVLPARPNASPDCQPPSLTALSLEAMPLARPRISAQACSFVGLYPGGDGLLLVCPVVPATMIPLSAQVFKSIEAFLMPVVHSSFKFGKSVRTSLGKAVLSRIVDMIAKGCKRSINAFLPEVDLAFKVSGKVTISRRSEIEENLGGAMS